MILLGGRLLPAGRDGAGRYPLHLPAETTEHAVIDAARSRSVGLYGMSTYRADHCPEPPQLVLGFGNTSQQAIRTGIAVLGDILTKGH